MFPGPYAICLDNSMSRLNSKLVYMYIVTYVQDKWEEYVKEIDDLHLTMENFTVSSFYLSSALHLFLSI